MKRFVIRMLIPVLLGGGLSAVEPDPIHAPEESAAFAGDRGSKVLARILPPPDPPRLAPGFRTEGRPRPGLATLERPEVPTAAPLTTLIGVPLAASNGPRPRPIPELAPLADLTFEPAPPVRIELPPAVLARTPARDVNRPIDLPVQAKYQLDRAGLNDPAAEFAVQAAHGPTPAPRDKPAPFERVDLPDPFAHRTVGTDWPHEPPIVAPVPQPPK